MMAARSERQGMWRCLSVAGLVPALLTLACLTQAQFLASKQAKAVETAVSRARFEMNCPDANGEVLNSEVTQWRRGLSVRSSPSV
jgi:hypothetical protein